MKRLLMAAGSGGAVGLLIGGWGGIVVGVAVTGVLWFLLPRMIAAIPSRELRRAGRDLPLASDLLAAALRAGASPDGAARVVGEALPGPVGERLTRVANALRLGEAPEPAWTFLADVPGGSRVARAASRSADSGAAFAVALVRLSDDLRVAQRAAVDASARKAAVLVVLPLGLCFLPAFLLAGVVPVVVSVLSGLLR
jgi:Flp pilus assembly protein TadB